MLKRLAQILFPESESTPVAKTNYRLPLATCVVLLEVARADDDFSDVERRDILQLMQDRFELQEEEASQLLHEAIEVRDQSADLWHFTHAINEGYSKEEKLQIIEALWRLVYSDGVLDGHEDHLMHKLRDLLNLNQPQLIEAKMKVLNEIRNASPDA